MVLFDAGFVLLGVACCESGVASPPNLLSGQGVGGASAGEHKPATCKELAGTDSVGRAREAPDPEGLLEGVCIVRGAWCWVLGAWCVVRGAWCVVRGAGCLVRGGWAWCVWCFVRGGAETTRARVEIDAFAHPRPLSPAFLAQLSRETHLRGYLLHQNIRCDYGPLHLDTVYVYLSFVHGR